MSFFLFHKIEDKRVIDHCDVFETSTFTRNWCGRCLKRRGGECVHCAVTVVLLSTYGDISVKIVCARLELKERTPGKQPLPKKKHIVRDELSCSYVHGGFWVVWSLADCDFWIIKQSKINELFAITESNTHSLLQ